MKILLLKYWNYAGVLCGQLASHDHNSQVSLLHTCTVNKQACCFSCSDFWRIRTMAKVSLTVIWRVGHKHSHNSPEYHSNYRDNNTNHSQKQTSIQQFFSMWSPSLCRRSKLKVNMVQQNYRTLVTQKLIEHIFGNENEVTWANTCAQLLKNLEFIKFSPSLFYESKP